MLLIKIDELLLGQMQKFCDKLQETTGLTKFKVEKWSYILHILLVSCMVWADYGYGGLVFVLPLLPLVAATVRAIEWREQRFVQKGELEMAYIEAPLLRITMLILWGYVILGALWDYDLLWVSAGIAYIVWQYATACTPRPPSKSKLQQGYERLLTKLNDWLAPTPAALPPLVR